MFGRVVSPKSGGGFGRIRLEDDEEMVRRGKDVARYFRAAVRANHW